MSRLSSISHKLSLLIFVLTFIFLAVYTSPSVSPQSSQTPPPLPTFPPSNGWIDYRGTLAAWALPGTDEFSYAESTLSKRPPNVSQSSIRPNCPVETEASRNYPMQQWRLQQVWGFIDEGPARDFFSGDMRGRDQPMDKQEGLLSLLISGAGVWERIGPYPLTGGPVDSVHGLPRWVFDRAEVLFRSDSDYATRKAGDIFYMWLLQPAASITDKNEYREPHLTGYPLQYALLCVYPGNGRDLIIYGAKRRIIFSANYLGD